MILFFVIQWPMWRMSVLHSRVKWIMCMFLKSLRWCVSMLSHRQDFWCDSGTTFSVRAAVTLDMLTV